jgi:pimeloyl-ACP methyl ester carboxylesterase
MRRGGGWARLVARGVVALTLAALLGCSPLRDEAPVEWPEAPILFVHGSGLSSASWERMREAFGARGYPREYLAAVDMLPRTGANDTAAAKFIAPAVEALLRAAAERARQADRPPPERVDIVAHSMGAFSSRLYVRDNAERVRAWISLAGANHGTNALCGFEGEGDRQMCPAFAASAADSALQVALNGSAEAPLDPSPYGIGDDGSGVHTAPDGQRRVAYVTLRIDPDEWIVPAASAMLNGSGGLGAEANDLSISATSPGNFLLRANVAHDDLPQDDRVLRFVWRLLRVADADF